MIAENKDNIVLSISCRADRARLEIRPTRLADVVGIFCFAKKRSVGHVCALRYVGFDVWNARGSKYVRHSLPTLSAFFASQKNGMSDTLVHYVKLILKFV